MALNIALKFTEGQLTPNEVLLCKRAFTVLHTSYPGHTWGVDIDGAMMTIRNKRLGNWGYRINLLCESNIEWAAMMAGGECLERFNQRRGMVDIDSIKALPTDAKQNPVPTDA